MENNKSNTKISGYLEKKGKNMLGSYKKYWFVLEGGLLVYYRSKLEYDNISPCKGCINLGPPCNIKPLHSTTGAFQLQTRTSTITLRAVTREEQNRWMQAIISEINPNKPQQRMSHFRYSLDELPQVKEQPESDDKVTNSEEEPPANTQLHDAIIQRLQKMGGQSYVIPSIATKTATLERDTQAVSQEHQQKISAKLESSTHSDSIYSEHLYERITSKSQNKSLLFSTREIADRIEKSKSLPRGESNTVRIKLSGNRPITFILENDTDAISFEQKDSGKQSLMKHSSKNKVKTKKFGKGKGKKEIVSLDNELYGSTERAGGKQAVQMTQENMENDLYGNNIVNNLNQCQRQFEEHEYSIPDQYEVKNKEETIYSDYVEYAEPHFDGEDEYQTIVSCKEQRKNETENIVTNSKMDEKGRRKKDKEKDNTLFLSYNKNKLNNSQGDGTKLTLVLENEIYALATNTNEKYLQCKDGNTEKYLIENDLYACTNRDMKMTQSSTIKTEKSSSKKSNLFFSNKKPKYSIDKHKTPSCFSQENEINASSAEQIIENDIYSCLDIENNQYSTINTELNISRDHNENNIKPCQMNTEEYEYSMPDLHTVNNTIEEVEYAEPRFDEEYRNGDKMTHTEKKGGKEKNDLDDHKSHSKQKNATEHAGSECYEDAKNKNKSGCKHKDKRSNEKEPKVKKRGSFIRRVLRKKDKHKDKNETRGTEEDNLYEIIPEANSEKLDIDDGKAVQMLSELQNILVQKVPILIQKLNVDDSYPNEKKSDGIQEITTNIKQPVLSEQRIPVLPHKTQKLDNPSPFHDIPRNNKPVALPPKKNIQFESLDDILDDLDNQNHSNKVKHLIKRFSEPEFSDVVLRTNRKSDSPRDELESDELSRLLEELAKVTNAPILTPGVTSSFNGSNVDNTEFSKLIFEKRRRHSEPDYDIPRPHKSLTILPRREESSENVIGSTRFFGPILKPSDMAVNANNRYLETPRLNSITPDSLETDIPSKIALPPPMNDENSCEPYLYFSYIDKNAFYNGKSSHSEKSSSISSDINIDNDIYVCPKVIHRFGLMKENTEVESYCGFDDVTEEDEEVFVDSLENNGDLNEGHTAL